MGCLLDRCTDVAVFILHLTIFCKYTLCADKITAQATCTGTMMMYVDGEEVARHTDKNTAIKFQIPADSKIVGIYCLADKKQNPVAGIIAQFDMIDVGNYFTDSTWKCSNTFSREWMDVDFDDSSWAYAEALTYNNLPIKLTYNQGVFKQMSGIIDHAQYIWTEKQRLISHGDPAVYCRGHIGYELYYSNYGRRFAVAFMDNSEWKHANSREGNHLHLFTYKPTWVTVFCFTPLLRSKKNYWHTIERISIKYPKNVYVPKSLRHEGAIKNGNTGIICIATAPISIIGLNQEYQKTDNFLSLPLDQLGGENEAMEYYALNWDGVDGGKDVRMLIMAVYDQTVIEVHPTTTIIVNGRIKVPETGATFKIALKKYATYQFAGTDINLSGTRLLSNRPIIVYCGNKLTKVLSEGSKAYASEHLAEQMLPVKCWGKKFIIAPLPHGTIFRKKGQLAWYKVIAAKDKTEITITFSKGLIPLPSKTVTETLNAGSYYQWGKIVGESVYVTATFGIMVAQFSTTEEGDNCVGDAWQMMIPPVELYHNFYQVFLTELFTNPRYPDCNERMILTFMVPTRESHGLMINGRHLGQLDNKIYKKIGEDIIMNTRHRYLHFYCVFQGVKSLTLRHFKPYINFGVYFMGYANFDAFSTAAGVRLAPINKPCVKTYGQYRADGIDNNCDGFIDDTSCRWLSPSQDCSVLDPVDGNWGSWSRIGGCICAGGFRQVDIMRRCDDPPPSDRGNTCEGKSIQTATCTCEKKDGAWSAWFPWSQCTGSCLDGISRNGKRIRTRTCSNPFPANGGKNCPEQDTENESCTTVCLIDLMRNFKDCKLDLVILMDRSGSISRGHWLQMIEFIQLFIKAFTIDEDHVQIALATFATEVTVRCPFGTDFNAMRKIIDKLPRPTGSTATALALEKVHEILQDSRRRKADKVLLLLTDGEPTVYLNGTRPPKLGSYVDSIFDDIKKEAVTVAETLRPKLEALLVIGVRQDVSKEFLLSLAGKRSNYIRFENFIELTQNLLLILTATCSLGKTGFLTKFIEEPQNVAAVQGSGIKLKCTAPNALSTRKHDQVWEDFRNSSKPVVMSSNWNIGQAYKNKLVLDGMYHLKIDNTTMDLAGKYCCHDEFEEDINQRCAEVIMLESQPIFKNGIPDDTIVTEGYEVSYSCEVKYRGRWGPVITWTDSDGESVSHEDMSTTAFAKSVIKFDATRKGNNKVFTCITHFGEKLLPPPGDGEATNAPTYTHTMKSDVLKVHYPPQSTRIVHDTGRLVSDINQVSVGDVVICQTESNPIEEDLYHWYTDTDDLLGTTPDITVTEDFVNAFTITCIVENTLGKDSAEISTSEVSKSVSDNGMVAGAATGTILCLLVLVGTLLLLSVMRRRKGENKKKEEPDSPQPPDVALDSEPADSVYYSLSSMSQKSIKNKKKKKKKGNSPYSSKDMSEVSLASLFKTFDDW